MSDKKPGITEKWIEEKAVEIYNYLYYKTFNLDEVRSFIRLLVKEIESRRIMRVD